MQDIYTRCSIYVRSQTTQRYFCTYATRLDISLNKNPTTFKCAHYLPIPVFYAMVCANMNLSIELYHLPNDYVNWHTLLLNRAFYAYYAHTCQPERSFGGTNGEPPSEASQPRKGGPGVLPRKISKTYIANGAIYVIPELYLWILYPIVIKLAEIMQVLLQYRLIVILNCRLNYTCLCPCKC